MPGIRTRGCWKRKGRKRTYFSNQDLSGWTTFSVVRNSANSLTAIDWKLEEEDKQEVTACLPVCSFNPLWKSSGIHPTHRWAQEYSFLLWQSLNQVHAPQRCHWILEIPGHIRTHTLRLLSTAPVSWPIESRSPASQNQSDIQFPHFRKFNLNIRLVNLDRILRLTTGKQTLLFR